MCNLCARSNMIFSCSLRRFGNQSGRFSNFGLFFWIWGSWKSILGNQSDSNSGKLCHKVKIDSIESEFSPGNHFFHRSPPGCLQYLFGSEGKFQSFNFGGNGHLEDQNYAICVRQELGNTTHIKKNDTTHDAD